MSRLREKRSRPPPLIARSCYDAMKTHLRRETVQFPFLQKIVQAAHRNKLWQRGDRILVAVSGGPDSVALLSALSTLAPSSDLCLWAAHCNHGLRGSESDGDARFVAKLCDRMGIALSSERLPVSRRRRSLQEAAREARYAVLDRIAHEVGANKIALGHTADDQAETMLMWMLRGAGMSGLSGIPPVREGR